MPQELEALFLACRSIFDTKLKNCSPSGDLAPLGVFNVAGTLSSVVFPPFADDVAKDGAAELLAAFAKVKGACQLAFISIAWATGSAQQRPSEARDRSEVVMLLLESPGVAVQVLFPLQRSVAASPTVGEPTINVVRGPGLDALARGRFAGMLGREDVHPEAIAYAERALSRLKAPTRH